MFLTRTRQTPHKASLDSQEVLRKVEYKRMRCRISSCTTWGAIILPT